MKEMEDVKKYDRNKVIQDHSNKEMYMPEIMKGLEK
jgi:hypothetical protein